RPFHAALRLVEQLQRRLGIGRRQPLGPELGVPHLGAQLVQRDLPLLVNLVDPPRQIVAPLIEPGISSRFLLAQLPLAQVPPAQAEAEASPMSSVAIAGRPSPAGTNAGGGRLPVPAR